MNVPEGPAEGNELHGSYGATGMPGLNRDRVLSAVEDMLAGETTVEKIGDKVYVWFWLDNNHLKVELLMGAVEVEKTRAAR